MSDPRNMLAAAKRQAHERADREGVTCVVYVKASPVPFGLDTYYVRTVHDDSPVGARLEYSACVGSA